MFLLTAVVGKILSTFLLMLVMGLLQHNANNPAITIKMIRILLHVLLLLLLLMALTPIEDECFAVAAVEFSFEVVICYPLPYLDNAEHLLMYNFETIGQWTGQVCSQGYY